MVPPGCIRVSSLAQAPRLAQGWAQQVISLLDPNIQNHIPTAATFGLAAQDHHTEYMFDVDRATNQGAPSLASVVRILNFASRINRILVHCHAGMSRSPSIAMGLLMVRGYPAREAIRFVLDQNLYDNEGSYMEPNELILHHLDRRLGYSSLLVPMVREEMIR